MHLDLLIKGNLHTNKRLAKLNLEIITNQMFSITNRHKNSCLEVPSIISHTYNLLKVQFNYTMIKKSGIAH